MSSEATIFFVLLFIAVLAFTIYAAVQFGAVVVNKGYPEKKTMIIVLCIFLPIAGYLLTCALPDNTQREIIKNKQSSTGNKRTVVSDELPEL